MSRKPVVLIIRDGWGENHDPHYDSCNAVTLAHTPVADRIRQSCPRTEIEACGLAVGLPEGVMGNSEVGHQNIGAGRVVDQEVVRINKALEDGSLRDNPVLGKVFERARSGALHLFGIVSDAGVHGLLDHLYGLVRLAREAGLERVYLHAFTDGRDTGPETGRGYLQEVEDQFASLGLGTVASVTGRYWAMDRDKRWDRVQRAYDTLTGRAPAQTARSAREAVESYYANPSEPSMHGDEFIPPTLLLGEDGTPIATVQDGDAVIFYNYRGDRPRELTQAFIDPDFDGFERGPRLDLFYATMTNYQTGLCPNVILEKPPQMEGTLGATLSDRGIPQFRCAETEKFPHVTFFFNDYREEPFEGEDRVIVPSPKEVSTYDQKPEMSARGVCDAALEAIRAGKYGLIVVNFANPDMVGHTGSIKACITACEVVDACVGELLEATENMQGAALVTADHGNSDQLQMKDGSPHTSHTLNPVEVVIVGDAFRSRTLKAGGKLGDIAPTLLAMMGEAQPAPMTGESLFA